MRSEHTANLALTDYLARRDFILEEIARYRAMFKGAMRPELRAYALAKIALYRQRLDTPQSRTSSRTSARYR